MFNKKPLNGGFLPLFILAAKMAQAFLRRAIFLCNNQPQPLVIEVGMRR